LAQAVWAQVFVKMHFAAAVFDIVVAFHFSLAYTDDSVNYPEVPLPMGSAALRSSVWRWTVIAGVPLHTAFSHWTSDNTPESRCDWIVQLPATWSTEMLRSYSEGSLPGNSEIPWKGHPSEGGLPSIIFRGTQWELEQFLDLHSGCLFVEQDAPMIEASDASAPQVLDPTNWGLDRIDSEEALDNIYDSSGSTGKGVHVYVIDTGIRTTHDDFGGRAVPTLEVLGNGPIECNASDTTCANDVNGHGTHCAGTVGGATYGVAKEATLHAVKVLADHGFGSFSWFIEAIDFIVTKGLRPAVISASLGGFGSWIAIDNAINMAISAGIPVVVAAMNEGNTRFSNACDYTPAAVPGAITVGSIGDPRYNDRRSSFSNIGECVDIFAPGGLIPSCGVASDSAVTFMSGTSMATPHVAGAAALLLGEDPSRPPSMIDDILKARSSKDKIEDVGAGSPNRLLFVGASNVTVTTTTSATATTATTTNTDSVTATTATITVSSSTATTTITIAPTTTATGTSATMTMSSSTATTTTTITTTLTATGTTMTVSSSTATTTTTITPTTTATGTTMTVSSSTATTTTTVTTATTAVATTSVVPVVLTGSLDLSLGGASSGELLGELKAETEAAVASSLEQFLGVPQAWIEVTLSAKGKTGDSVRRLQKSSLATAAMRGANRRLQALQMVATYTITIPVNAEGADAVEATASIQDTFVVEGGAEQLASTLQGSLSNTLGSQLQVQVEAFSVPLTSAVATTSATDDETFESFAAQTAALSTAQVVVLAALISRALACE